MNKTFLVQAPNNKIYTIYAENKFMAIQAAKVYDDYKFSEIAYKIIYKNKFGKFKN
jgi:hypothetical protein